MLSRRRFMFLLGGAATGVWLASTGLVTLERNFVLSLGGACSFCGTPQREVRALVGTPNQPTKICDNCVGFCCDIIVEELGVQSHRDVHRYAAPNLEDEQFQLHVGEILQRLAAERETARHESLLGDLRRSFTPADKAFFEMFRCSFCDAQRQDVAKLISGPRVFICDGCIGDASAVVSHVLRTS